MKSFHLVGILMFSISHARADCSSVDLSASLGEVRSQDNAANWCYAFGAADLISFYLKQKISAADIAFQETPGIRNRTDILDTEGGSMQKSVERTLQRGACLESQLPSHPLKLQSDLNADPESFWRRVDIACQSRISFPSVQVVKDYSKKKALIRKINSVLDTDNVVEVRIDASIFKTPDVGRRKVNHDVLVVGRRWNSEDGVCEYKIRNSWGPDCKRYREDVVCENGNLWLTEDDVMRASKEMIYLIQR